MFGMKSEDVQALMNQTKKELKQEIQDEIKEIQKLYEKKIIFLEEKLEQKIEELALVKDSVLHQEKGLSSWGKNMGVQVEKKIQESITKETKTIYKSLRERGQVSQENLTITRNALQQLQKNQDEVWAILNGHEKVLRFIQEILKTPEDKLGEEFSGTQLSLEELMKLVNELSGSVESLKESVASTNNRLDQLAGQEASIMIGQILEDSSVK